MTRFDQDWCNTLVEGVSSLGTAGPLRLLYVITDTEEGKMAFSLRDDGTSITATAGKLPRGEKADITVTAKESVLVDIWSGTRSRDEAFMAGDIKIEGAYSRWLDELVATFEASPWASAWERTLS